MEGLIVILVLVAVGVGIAVGLSRRSRSAAPAGRTAIAPSLQPGGTAVETGTAGDLRRLRLGDVVHHEGRDWIVDGSLRYEQGGSRWEEHKLVDADDVLWISVEDDERLEVALWQRVRAAGLEPGPDTVTHDGVGYELDERGHASFTAEGNTGTAGGGRMEYADYVAPDGRLLGFERFGDGAPWELSTGRPISEHEVEVYPARS